MRFQLRSSAAILMMAIYGSCAQANSDVKINGTIQTSACSVSLTGGGDFNYGVIKANTLNAKSGTYIGEKLQNFAITCDSPHKIALRTVDNRKDLLAPNLIWQLPESRGQFDDTWAFGLGTDTGGKLGAYVVRFKPDSLSGDLQHTRFLLGYASDDLSTVNWGSSTRFALDPGGKFVMTFSKENGTSPLAYRSLTGTIYVETMITEAEHLSTRDDIRFHGQSTLELQYW